MLRGRRSLYVPAMRRSAVMEPLPLDLVLPRFAHRTRHATRVAAPAPVVWTALHEVTVAELPLTRALTSIRGLGGGRGNVPVLTAFTARGFTTVLERPGRFVVLAAAGQPWRMRGGDRAQRLRDVAEVQAYARPGHVVMAASFAVGADGRLSTETRVQPVDADAARAFGRYWWVVRAGSGLIRHDLLRAVRRRAERAAA